MAFNLFIKISNNSLKGHVANFGIFTRKIDYKKCYQILGIQETSDQEQIRAAYLNLVKRFHPDSGTEEASDEKFKEIDKAFRILINKKSKERWDVEEGVIVDDHPDIKHTAPQHRQYLNYDGVGSGNPFQREKQYAQMRATQAAKNVYEHGIAKATAEEKTLINKEQIHETWVPLDHKIKTKHGFDRLVEDLIQESIARGEFKNLKNSGKPLPTHQNMNPYVDFVTHKINEVLIENGFTPEWITLQKEIREEAGHLRNDLLTERKHFGPYPLSVEENIVWSEKVYHYKNVVETINKKITKFNLLVPILNKQMLHVCLEKEAQKAMVNGKSTKDILDYGVHSNNVGCDTGTNSVSVNLFSILDYFFKGK
ncbi:unnamed protein product [Phaedon cochleariae]|uniref:J domain-containing protein n=1 Tax=Phaedon cochleariae TaxID=80249 RepID=A0A9P0GNA4_PHACE|nr:unnamed protein product [Phaedon cochleariae]